MKPSDIMARFEKVPSNEYGPNLEVLSAEEGRLLIFRDSTRSVIWARAAKYVALGLMSSMVILAISSLIPVFSVLLIPLFLVGLRYLTKPVRPQEHWKHFEIDIWENKILLPTIPYKPQVHKELKIDSIHCFYAWYIEHSPDSHDVSVRCTYQNDEAVVIMRAGPFDVDQCARLLGLICDKPVWKRDYNGTMSGLT